MRAAILEQAPERDAVPSRRHFVRRLMGGAAAAAVFPDLVAGNTTSDSGETLASVFARGGTVSPDEGFWRLVKEQFPLRDGLVLMNAANLCPAPYSVVEVVFDLTRDVDADTSFQNREKFGDMREAALAALARYLGVGADEVVITRNTTEGNNVVTNGLDLGPGDEVVIWDQNHPTNNVAWDVRAHRRGFSVRRVATRSHPESVDDLVAPFLEALSPRTRVLAFSHVSNVSGVALPAARLCDEAARRGVLTLVDGAQSFGALALDLRAMGCDFYAASTHKWLMGPKEAGVLYVRRDCADEVWPLMVGVGWEGAHDQGARRFGTLGQRDDATVAAVARAVEFHEALGTPLVEARVRQLAGATKERLAHGLPGIRFHTPLDPQLSAGLVVFALPGKDARDVYKVLYKEHGVGCAAMGGDFAGIRLSPHVYNLLEEVDRVVAAVSAA